MRSHRHFDFRSLYGWMEFCQEANSDAEARHVRQLIEDARSPDPWWKQDGAPEPHEAGPDLDRVDEIQQAVQSLTCALDSYEDALELANLWLKSLGGGQWQLVRRRESVDAE